MIPPALRACFFCNTRWGLLVLIIGAVMVPEPVPGADRWRTTTLAGTGKAGAGGDGGPASEAQLNNPFGIVRGPDRAVYLCDMGNHKIRRIRPDGIIETVAGTGSAGYAGDGGPAVYARLNEPYEVRFDSQTNLYFVEMRNHIIRRVDRHSGTISTVAGTGAAGFGGDDGPAVRASLNQPHSLAVDSHDDLYICDIGNHRIRRIRSRDGVIATFAGTGRAAPTTEGGRLAAVDFNGPRALDFDASGNIWLALREGNAVYLLDLSAGVVRHRAGTGKKGFTGNGGPARTATLSGPKGISVGPGGVVYLADTESHSVRSVDPASGRLELVAGTGEKGDGPDGEATLCRLARPHGIYAETDGSLLVGDSESHRVRVLRRVPAESH